ncbi:DUF1828 domain-containing protein [Companilactobacillus mishanensis]|uniref:DUF1828 domain-containing protein n=1 Tax=Companilactobacillus mishanensis TaxID=2486008 RepID=A0ABW9P6F9_9LACO|nr:DUF1828 domain-containing protein [Companilactobacillus mishanensis]MQS44746.1 DUF1828 domain-containing protein [Companilactobacillus mishanensis]
MTKEIETKELKQSIKEFYANAFSFSSPNNSEYTRIDTPFYDRHKNQVILYTKRVGDSYILTDGGYVLDDIESNDFYLKETKNRQLLESQLNIYSISVNFENNELYIKSRNLDDLGMKLNLLLQAVLFVNCMHLNR